MNMNSLLIFLPDFIGHPWCYYRLIALIKRQNQYASHFVSYHNNIDDYFSIPQLGQNIFEILLPRFKLFQKIILVGYSFGGVIGFELSKLMETHEVKYHLIIIDCHLNCAPLPTLTLQNLNLQGLLQKHPNFEFINQLISLGEINPNIIE